MRVFLAPSCDYTHYVLSSGLVLPSLSSLRLDTTNDAEIQTAYCLVEVVDANDCRQSQ